MNPEVVSSREQELTNWLQLLLNLFDGKPYQSQAFVMFLTNKADITPSGWAASDLPKETSPKGFERPRKSDQQALWNQQLGGRLHCHLHCKRVAVDREGTPLISDVELFVGMIDVLQEYNLTKRMETAYKSMYGSVSEISSIDSTAYGDRFLGFMKEYVFLA